MAKRTFQEIVTEITAITDEYQSIILDAHESADSLFESQDAYERLTALMERLNSLVRPTFELSDYKDRVLANSRLTAMTNVVGSLIERIDCQNRKSTEPEPE